LELFSNNYFFCEIKIIYVLYKMVLSNYKELEAFALKVELSGGFTDTMKYLLDPSLNAYNIMKIALDNAILNFTADMSNNGSGLTGMRILVTLADGTVVFDSSKLTDNAGSTINSFINAKNKIINENHMSRIAILIAALSAAGIAAEMKFSTSTGKFEQYLAIRLGKTSEHAIGIIRFSFLGI
jgi:hypothetical protein